MIHTHLSLWLLFAFLSLGNLCAQDSIPDRVSFSELLSQTVPFLSREVWKAQPPVLTMHPHRIRQITIHHSAVDARKADNPARKIQGLQRFSQEAGFLGNGKGKPAWADVPYHYIIYANGTVVEGRDVNYAGDTNTTYDPAGHLLINVEGNFQHQRPTKDQMRALKRMLVLACGYFEVQPESIGGHRDYAKTACPGNRLYRRIPGLKAQTRRRK